MSAVATTTLPADLTVLCRCAHPADAHEHYRPGTDCSACDCRSFRRNRVWVRLLELVRRPRTERRDDGLTALLDAVMAEQRRGPCGCLACQLEPDHDGEFSR